LEEKREIITTRLWSKLLSETNIELIKSEVVGFYGGKGGSKSYTIAQFMIHKLLNEQNKLIAIGRKTFPALRMTAYKLITDLLIKDGWYQYVQHNKSDHTIDYGTNRIQFFSLDDPTKIFSFDANYIWLEETIEFTWDDFRAIRLCLRRPPGKEINQVFLSFNPIDENHWLKQKLWADPDVTWIHSTYKDNPFLPKSYVRQLEGLIEQDEGYYRVYTLGEWGTLENVIYPTWTQIDDMPREFEHQGYGLDFGYENPSVCIHVGVMGDNLYLDELVYQTHLTNAELIDALKTLRRLDIHADSAEPQRIEELCRAGLNAYPAMKDVKLGIDTVKRYKIHLTKRSANLIKEIRSYQRKKDKSGKILEEPVKFNDHCLDASRYGVVGLVGLKPLIPQEQIIELNTMDFVPDLDL